MGADELVTRLELADIFDVHPQTVTKWEREGMPIAHRGGRGRPSKYSEQNVRAWRDARDEAARNGSILDPVQERARRERAQAILAEQSVAIRAGELVPRELAEKAWIAEVSAVRAKLLSWPTTLADRLYREGTLNGLGGLEKELKAAVSEVLLELAHGDHGKPRRKSHSARKK